MIDWERFAAEDAYRYICTGTPRRPRTHAEVQAFLEAGAQTAAALLAQVEADLPGRSLAIEIGCGIGRLLLPHAARFDEVRGVDVSPTMLSGTRALADEQGHRNVRTYLPDEPWDEPPGSADYVYSFLVFQHIEAPDVIATYMTRTAGALRPGGIAQFQFDTRSPDVLYRLRGRVPDALLPRTQRRAIRRVRRDAAWIRALADVSELELLRQRDIGSAAHWFVLRRR